MLNYLLLIFFVKNMSKVFQSILITVTKRTTITMKKEGKRFKGSIFINRTQLVKKNFT